MVIMDAAYLEGLRRLYAQYPYAYIRLWVCRYVYVHARVCVHMCVCKVYARFCAHMCMCMLMNVYKMCMGTYMYVYAGVCIHTCVCMLVNAQMVFIPERSPTVVTDIGLRFASKAQTVHATVVMIIARLAHEILMTQLTRH